ncbi:BTAD domain-containing putative transcriptional regulator [Streptomyces sp. NPDC057743]|uniref:AfsR/SARP family transcriptional regulator n=1 Tax=Streptomyces sp. NPDC057743 TaxID=3346236 RepID=UPI0036B8286A
MTAVQEAEQQAELRFTVLGPVRAWRGDTPLPTGSPQQRALLAALLFRRGGIATLPELIDCLWGDEPPHSALPGIRTYASRLRKVLGPEVVVSESGGYGLRVADTAWDLGAAERLVAEAQRAARSGDRASAHRLLQEALDLWDGEPLAGLPGPFAESQRTRLWEWRLQLTEERLELDLEAGHHAEAVTELTALTAAHPLRERLRELLMLALYRSGRQAEALAVYADTRRLLADELGVDPRAELSDLHQRILRADPGLTDHASQGATGERSSRLRPSQLPSSVPDFTGRSTMVNALTEELRAAQLDGGSVMAVWSVAGLAGIGKTALAVHAAHAVREHFPDGQLYADLRGSTSQPVAPEDILGSFLHALGMPLSEIPDGLEARSAWYRSRLAGLRILVLLDDARDAAQVRPLLPGTAGCATLITGRRRMIDLFGAHLIDLDVLPPQEALALFARVVGEERVGAERNAAMDIIAACGFHPLAIRIAAARLAARRTWTVSLLAHKLTDGRRRLDELLAGDLSVRAAFDPGYGQLGPTAARAFRLLGLVDGPDISLPAATALFDNDIDETEELLESLVDFALLEPTSPGRYRFHDLVRLYARSCAEQDEPAAARAAARSRLLDFYLAMSTAVYALEHPAGAPLTGRPKPTAPPGRRLFQDSEEARDWLYTEADNLLACARSAAANAQVAPATDLLWVTREALAGSGRSGRAYVSTAEAVRDAARSPRDAARARMALAGAHLIQGRTDQAHDEAEQAAALAEETGEPALRSWALNILGSTALSRGQLLDAERSLLRASEGFHQTGDQSGTAATLAQLSRLRLAQGDTNGAVDAAEEAVTRYDRLGDDVHAAMARYALGTALTSAGRLEAATDHLARSLEVFRNARRRAWEGLTLFRMAEVHLTAGHAAQAANLAELSLAAMRWTDNTWHRVTTLTLLGRALADLGHRDRARVCWQEALSLHETLNSPEAHALSALLDAQAQTSAAL